MEAMSLPSEGGSSSSGDIRAEISNHEAKLTVPSRNPLPLSASQEAQVREVYYARVRRHCAGEIEAFAACTRTHTFTIPFACRASRRAMNACMLSHATTREQDLAREEWFARRLERQREREHKARRAKEQERFIREWWRLPVDEEAERRRESEMEEKLAKGERVAGVRRSRRQRDVGGEEGR